MSTLNFLDSANPNLLLEAYKIGLFPMSESGKSKRIFWVDPELRGILPLNDFRISRSLKKLLRKDPFEVKYNYKFEEVINACAEYRTNRNDTWINDTIVEIYTKLFYMKHVHTVECWLENKLVGGLYGVAINGAFFGESMFSKVDNASKVALFYLVSRLKERRFLLLDTQFLTKHLSQFGAIEVSRGEYQKLLSKALSESRSF